MGRVGLGWYEEEREELKGKKVRYREQETFPISYPKVRKLSYNHDERHDILIHSLSRIPVLLIIRKFFRVRC